VGLGVETRNFLHLDGDLELLRDKMIFEEDFPELGWGLGSW